MNCVGLPKHAGLAVNVTTGKGLTSTVCVAVAVQEFAPVTVRVVVYVDALANVCVGFVAVDKADPSPKFQE
jgi:hypothetical protein